jgi:hypothetical protein
MVYEPIDEFFNPLWADFDSEIDQNTFRKKVIDTVGPVLKAWQKCRSANVKHKGRLLQWIRPAFCECKPYSGKFSWDRMGNHAEHILVDESNREELRFTITNDDEARDFDDRIAQRNRIVLEMFRRKAKS